MVTVLGFLQQTLVVESLSTACANGVVPVWIHSNTNSWIWTLGRLFYAVPVFLKVKAQI